MKTYNHMIHTFVSSQTTAVARHHHRNAGFIRQRPGRLVALPDKSGVPAGGPFPLDGGVKMRPWLPALVACAILGLVPHILAQPFLVITTPADGSTNGSLPAVSGWVTNAADTITNLSFSLHEVDPSGRPGRYWNGSNWQATASPLATTRTGTNWSAAVTLPPLNSGISYEITASATTTTPETGTAMITTTRTTDVLTWDLGTTHAGTAVKTNPHALGGPFIFQIVTSGTTVGGWRSALTVTSGEANLYLSQGSAPTFASYQYGSAQVGSDGFVVPAAQFGASEVWYYLVDNTTPGSTWTLVSGEPYVLDLGVLPDPAAVATTNVTIGAEGYRFFRTTTPPGPAAWQLWLGGAANSIQVKQGFIPLTGDNDHEQARAMLLVPDYLAGSVTYFVAVPGLPGQALSFTSKQQPITDLAFNFTTNGVAVSGFPYTTYRVAVPTNQIAWEVATTPLAGQPNVAARRGKVPNEFNSDAFSEVAGLVENSFTMVPPGLSDGTFYVTVYSTAAHTYNLRNGEPTISSRVFLGTTTNDAPARAGWRFYVLTNITEQVGVLGWELELSNQVAGTEIALRRNAVPSRWFGRTEGATFGPVSYVDYSGTAGFLQRPGHQADIWYIGIFQPATNLGPFTLTTRAMTAPPLAFNSGVTNIVNLAQGRWTYFRVDAPADMLGWDARLTNVTAGDPQLTVRRDLLPDAQGGWAGSDWPSGLEVSPGTDWTGLAYTPTGANDYGRIFTVGRNNFLQTGTYYIGVHSVTGPASFRFTSRGIGTNYAIGVTNLAFSGAGGKATNSAGLPVREAAYYQVVVPSNSPNWLLRLTPTSGDAVLGVEKDVLPNINVGAYGNTHDRYGKILRKIGKQQYLLLPADGRATLDAETNYLVVASSGIGQDYVNSRVGSNMTTYVLESLGSLLVTNLGTGVLPVAGGGSLTQHIAQEGGRVTIWNFTVPAGVAAMQVSLTNQVGNPSLSLVPGTNAPYPHVPAGSGENYGADGGWTTGRRETFGLMTIAAPAAGPWTLTIKAEPIAGVYPDAACDVEVVALAPTSLGFDAGSPPVVVGQTAGTWRYFSVSVPADALSWDLRLTNVNNGAPMLTIRRGLCPDEAGAPGVDSYDWPSGAQLAPGGDLTGRKFNFDGSDNSGRFAAMAMGNVLTNDTYFIGVYASGGASADYTLVSRGVGSTYAIPVRTLNFSGADSAHTNTTGLPAREAAYYRVIVPANAPSWHVRVTPDGDGELLLAWNPQVLPNSYGNPFGQVMQKPGIEQFTRFADEGQVFLPPGTNWLAVWSEGVAPTDGSHTGSNNVTYRIESLGSVPVVDLGGLPPNGPAIAQTVTMAVGEVKLFRFTLSNSFPSIELRLTNGIASPALALRPGTNAPVPQVPYIGPYYGVAGGYYSQRLETTDLLTLANAASGVYTLSLFGMDVSGAYTNSIVDLSITPRGPTNLDYLNGSQPVTGQLPGTWRFFSVSSIPADTLGWELRVTGAGCDAAAMSVRRDDLPEPNAPPTSIHGTNWPSGSQINAGQDWTGLNESDGTATYGHYLGFGRNNPLEQGNYYVGVLNTSTTDPLSYTLTSRGVGGAGGLPVTVLPFNGGATLPTALAPRDLAYYRVDVAPNTPSWRVRLDTSAGGEASLFIRKDYVPNISSGNQVDQVAVDGKALAKVGNEHYVLLPDDGQTNIAPGAYYLSVISEGINPAPPLIGTGDSTFTLESHGPLSVTDLGLAPPPGSMISNHVILEGGETKAFRFRVNPGVDWLEVRLANRSGNPGLAEVPSLGIPAPAVPFMWFGYGANGGWMNGRKEASSFLTLIRPPATNTLTLQAGAQASTYPDAATDLEILQLLPTSLVFSNGSVAGSLADNQRTFYRVIVPTNQLAWQLQLTPTNGTPTLRVNKDVLPSDDDPEMSFGGPSVIIAPPFLQPGTWYVEVRGGGATDFTLSSNPVRLERPAWAMPAYGGSVTTIGLPPAGPIFADSGVDVAGNPVLPDQGTDLGVGGFHFYSFTVPDGNAGLLRAELDAVSRYPDLYIRRGGIPTYDHLEFGYTGASLVDYQLTATGTGSEYANWVPLDGKTETQLGSGTWYVSVRATDSSVRYRLQLSVGIVTNLLNGATLAGQVLVSGDWRYYRIAVPSNAPQSLTVTWSQQQGHVDLRVRDTIPPGEPADSGQYREWSRDSKNGGPYPYYPDPGTYTLTVPPVRPNSAYYLGFRATGDSTFTVGVNFSAQNLDITNVVPFYGGTTSITLPPFGMTKFRVPVPVDATSWRHSNSHSGAIVLYLDQGTLPDVWGTGYRIWDSGGAPDSQLIKHLGDWPWVPNQHYFFIATNTSGFNQPLTLHMDGRNAATEGSTPLAFTSAGITGAGHFAATLAGPPGSVLVVLGSYDLVTWTPVTTNAPFTGTFGFEDPITGAHKARHYRASLQP
jgi:large repetitive protein